MENLSDYSHYIFAAYSIAGITLVLLMSFVVTKYCVLKNRIKNQKK